MVEIPVKDDEKDIEVCKVSASLYVEFERLARTPVGSSRTTGGMTLYRVFLNNDLIMLGGSRKYAYPTYKDLILKKVKKSPHK